jgi:hypothetical protein
LLLLAVRLVAAKPLKPQLPLKWTLSPTTCTIPVRVWPDWTRKQENKWENNYRGGGLIIKISSGPSIACRLCPGAATLKRTDSRPVNKRPGRRRRGRRRRRRRRRKVS